MTPPDFTAICLVDVTCKRTRTTSTPGQRTTVARELYAAAYVTPADPFAVRVITLEDIDGLVVRTDQLVCGAMSQQAARHYCARLRSLRARVSPP